MASGKVQVQTKLNGEEFSVNGIACPADKIIFRNFFFFGMAKGAGSFDLIQSEVHHDPLSRKEINILAT